MRHSTGMFVVLERERDDMSDFLDVDELDEGVFSLRIAEEMLMRVGDEPHYWEWVVVALHSALQAFMVCNLTAGGNLFRVLSEKDARQLEEAFHAGKRLPESRLVAFPKLYERVKREEFMRWYGHSRPLKATPSQDRNVQRLNTLRNQFIHFLPKTWGIELRFLEQAALDCIEIVSFLAFGSGNITWTGKESLEQSCRRALDGLHSLAHAWGEKQPEDH